jgi:hypothetical protein
VCTYAREVLGALLKEYEQTGESEPALVSAFTALTRSLNGQTNQMSVQGGVQMMRKDRILASLPSDPILFFSCRRSIRQFAPGQISEAAIRQAAQIARTSPSVCNRQSCHLYYSTDRSTIAEILSYTNGAGGFGDEAAAVFVITSELACFSQAAERNQGFIDGGIFAMTFALGMHALGYGSCFINWSATARRDRLLHRALGIRQSELVI